MRCFARVRYVQIVNKLSKQCLDFVVTGIIYGNLTPLLQFPSLTNGIWDVAHILTRCGEKLLLGFERKENVNFYFFCVLEKKEDYVQN